MIKIDFEFETKYGVFRDALYLPEDHSFTEDQLQEMKISRLNNWLDIIVNPTQVEEVITSEEEISTIDIAGESYRLLEGVPHSGAKLIEVQGVWYYKV